MEKPSNNVRRFSAKAASRRRLIRFVIGFIVIAALAAGSALILAVSEIDVAFPLYGQIHLGRSGVCGIPIAPGKTHGASNSTNTRSPSSHLTTFDSAEVTHGKK